MTLSSNSLPFLTIGTLSLMTSSCCRDEATSHPTPITASASASTSATATSTIPLSRKERIEIEGDPKIGTVYFVRQFHRHRLAMAINREVGEYQLAILRELTERKPAHVFKESLTEDLSPQELADPLGRYTSKEHRASQENVRKAFEGQWSVTNSVQRGYIGKLGADLVYGLINPGVSLHKTWTQDEETEFYNRMRPAYKAAEARMQEAEKKHREENEARVTGYYSWQGNVEDYYTDEERKLWQWLKRDFRESCAIQQIRNFLREHPGESVTLVYGGAHTFCAFNEEKEKPVVISVWWSGIANADLDKIPICPSL